LQGESSVDKPIGCNRVPPGRLKSLQEIPGQQGMGIAPAIHPDGDSAIPSGAQLPFVEQGDQQDWQHQPVHQAEGCEILGRDEGTSPAAEEKPRRDLRKGGSPRLQNPQDISGEREYHGRDVSDQEGSLEADQTLRGKPGPTSRPLQKTEREQIVLGKKKMEEGHQIGSSPIGGQRGHQLNSVVSSPVAFNGNNIISAVSPDLEVPPDAIENVRDFFNQILIKNITHIDAKINEIRLLTNVNLNEMQQISKVISTNLDDKIEEIHHINGNISADTRKLL
jgi:hypothetical protein